MLAFGALPPSVRKGSAFPIAVSFFEAATLMSPGGIAPIGRDVDYQRMARGDNGIRPQTKRQ